MSNLRSKFKTITADELKQEDQNGELNLQETQKPVEEIKEEDKKTEEQEGLTPQMAYAILTFQHFIEKEYFEPSHSNIIDILKDFSVELEENEGDYKASVTSMIRRRIVKIHQEEGWEVSEEDMLKDFYSDMEWFRTNTTPEHSIVQVHEILGE